MAKTPEMEKKLNAFAKSVFGRGRDEGVCVPCGSDKVKPENFRDERSWQEWLISRMCQECQDRTFRTDED